MDKKNIIYGGLIVVLVFFSIWAFMLLTKKDGNQAVPENNLVVDEAQRSITKTVPYNNGPDNKVSDNGNSLQGQDIFVIENSVISNPSNPEEVKKAIEGFYSKNSSNKIEWTNLVDSSGKEVSLENISKAVNLSLNQGMKSLLNANDTDFFSCNDSGIKSRGVILNIRLLPDYKGNSYQDAVMFMKEWEKTLFQDFSKILFYDKNISEDVLKQEPVFKDGQGNRYAEITLSNKEKISIDYELVDDFVIISSSLECLKKAKSQVFDTSG